MCSRYHISKKIIEQLKIDFPSLSYKTKSETIDKDIYPSDKALGLSFEKDRLILGEKSWGYPFIDKKLLINARAESLEDKKSFANGFRHKRLVLIADKFYEWNSLKEKYSLEREDLFPIYLAGIFDNFKGEDRFVIITRASDSKTSHIHSRMPLILDKEQVFDWLLDYNKSKKLLEKQNPPLSFFTDVEQQSFFNILT